MPKIEFQGDFFKEMPPVHKCNLIFFIKISMKNKTYVFHFISFLYGYYLDRKMNNKQEQVPV